MSELFEHSKEIEGEATALISKWKSSEVDSKTVKSKLIHFIESKTFNSPIIMRLYAEVLITEQNFEEGFAAFDSYVSLQKLNIFKSKTGARATFDPVELTTQLFLQKLDVLEDFELVTLEILSDTRQKLVSIVEEVPNLDEKLVAPTFARIALLSALKSQNDDKYNTEISEARKWFNKIEFNNNDFEASPDSASVMYSKGIFIAITETPSAAFPLVKSCLEIDPSNLRCALLLIRLLTADEQYEQALALTDMYLDKMEDYSSTADKITLLNLKKTHLGILELIRGPEVAFNELTDFITLVSTLFFPHAQLEKMNRGNTRKVQSQPLPVRSRIFSFRKRFDTQAIANNTATPQRVNENDSLESRDSVIMAFSWFWISQQYIRADLVDDAKQAMQEALEFLPAELELVGSAERYTMMGLIEQHKNKNIDRAQKYFKLALISHPTHIVAAVSAALTLGPTGTKPQEHSAACAKNETSNEDSEDSNSELELARTLLVNLETISTRVPGRFLPEVWMARGKVYEYLGDISYAREMYWKTIQLEERKALTSYVFSSSLYML